MPWGPPSHPCCPNCQALTSCSLDHPCLLILPPCILFLSYFPLVLVILCALSEQWFPGCLYIFQLTLVILFVEWFCIIALLCLLIAFHYLSMIWMANLINVLYTWVYHKLVFTITQEVVVANTLVALIFISIFSMMPKGGKVKWPCLFKLLLD